MKKRIIAEEPQNPNYSILFKQGDPFRTPCSSKFQGDFVPAKNFLPNDPFDNQNGEMEYVDEAIPGKYIIKETEKIEISLLEDQNA